MQLFAPTYYKKFKCIADRCQHNCCIGWEIDIDGETPERYKNDPENIQGFRGLFRHIKSVSGPTYRLFVFSANCDKICTRGAVIVVF